MKKDISLIIPTNTNNFYIIDILTNISMWSVYPSEIIIINTSRMKIKLENYLKNKFKKKRIKIKIINKINFFPGAARNVGITASSFKYIAFLDMNTVPYNKDWLKSNFNLIKQKKLDGVFGRTIYLVSNFKEKIIVSSTYGLKSLRTIPGSIFKKKLIKEVGFFNSQTRAGEDTQWLNKLDKYNFKLEFSNIPLFYKGLYNVNYKNIIEKWIRNYHHSANLPHLSSQKNFYILSLIILSLIFVFNIHEYFFSNQEISKSIFSSFTRNFLIFVSICYAIFRGIIFPIKKNVSYKFLFPINFLIILFFSFILDIVKALAFFSSTISNFLNLKQNKL